MPEQFIQDPNVALKWKLYAYLNGFWIGGKTVYARNDTLAKEFKKSERAIQSALGELEELGLITRDIKGLSRYILPGGIPKEGRSPASPTHEAQLHQGDEAQLHHISDSISDSKLGVAHAPQIVPVFVGEDSIEERPKSKPKYPHSKEVFGLWKSWPRNWSLNKTQLQAAENLYEERGLEEIANALAWYEKHKNDTYCPSITSPYDLDSKWAKLESFVDKL